MKKSFIQLIDKYLLGTATESETQLVETYMNRLEANDNAVRFSGGEEALKQDMWQHIQAQTTQQENFPIKKIWYQTNAFRITAIAASIVGLIGFAIFFFTNSTVPQQIDQNTTKVEMAPLVRRVVNTTGEDERFQLPDSSWVVLTNRSEVAYTEPFTKRDINLVGKAWFKVAKDTSKPFTVRSGAVSTTALGTEFLVNAFPANNQLTVRLYEGKVVVKAAEKENWRMKKDFYLQPGQEFVYNNNALAKVRSFNSKPAHAANQNEALYTDNPFIPKNAKGSWYMFNNQGLGQVLDQLSFTYDVPIIYNKKDVQNKYFVGRFKKEDSLSVILNYITIVNKLKVFKKENAYYITR